MQLRDCIPDWKKQEVTVMIIKRKYEWFGFLYEKDAEAKRIIDEAFELFQRPNQPTKEEVLKYTYSSISAFFDLGCGMDGNTYQYILKEFDSADKTVPYDNGLTVGDTTSVEHELSRHGKRLQLRLVNQMYDNPYRIVGFVTVSSENGKPVITDGWDMKLIPSGYGF